MVCIYENNFDTKSTDEEIEVHKFERSDKIILDPRKHVRFITFQASNHIFVTRHEIAFNLLHSYNSQEVKTHHDNCRPVENYNSFIKNTQI